MCYEPFYENTPNRYFGQHPEHDHHAEIALKAVGACETPSELAELEIRHFAVGYIERLIPSYGEKLRHRGPTVGDRAFDKMEAEFFRCLITKIPQKHPAVDSALFIRNYK